MTQEKRRLFLFFQGFGILVFIIGCAGNVEVVDSQPEVLTTETVTDEPRIPEPTPEELAARRAAELSCARITVSATGDIMLGTDFPENHLPDDDSEKFLSGVASVISGTDIGFGNLEGVLMDGGDPVKKCENPDACYLFRSPTRYARHLADAGFNVMSLANNHARDFGEVGRTSTMTALDAAGIRHSGRKGDIASWRNGDLEISMIAFAPFTNSYSMLDIDEASREVAVLAEKHNLVIVSFHGGAEGINADRVPFTTETYYGENRGDVVKFSRAMIDAGADLVIGHGPHVPRAMELYRQRLVAYSLGNFATYYGISVNGSKGYAPILVTTLDGHGRLINGQIVSARQLRPGGPVIDSRRSAYRQIRDLTEQDFDGGDLSFDGDGNFSPLAPLGEECAQVSESTGN